MKLKISHCPNLECTFHLPKPDWKFHKHGFFKTLWNGQPVRRYRCVACSKTFSTHTFRQTFAQKKPHLNKMVLQMSCSGMTQRRIAKVLKVNRKTIVRKFLFLSYLAKAALQKMREKMKVTQLQFDELLSFEHTRLKPLSIALAVSGTKPEQILALSVQPTHYRGVWAQIALSKYGPRVDKSAWGREEVLKAIAPLMAENPLVVTDEKGGYESEILKHLPTAKIQTCKSKSVRENYYLHGRRRNGDDPLFALNFVAAKIRHDVCRMMRRVWTTTKKAERLWMHLELFAAYHNKLSLV